MNPPAMKAKMPHEVAGSPASFTYMTTKHPVTDAEQVIIWHKTALFLDMPYLTSMVKSPILWRISWNKMVKAFARPIASPALKLTPIAIPLTKLRMASNKIVTKIVDCPFLSPFSVICQISNTLLFQLEYKVQFWNRDFVDGRFLVNPRRSGLLWNRSIGNEVEKRIYKKASTRKTKTVPQNCASFTFLISVYWNW